MLGKLKDAAGNAALQKAIDSFAPQLQPHLDRLKELDPALIRDDAHFTEKAVQPALLAISAASGGVTSLIPKFSERFGAAMLHLRDELLVLDGPQIGFAENFQQRLPEVLLAGFKKAAG